RLLGPRPAARPRGIPMTEHDWLHGRDPAPLLNVLRGQASGRKFRLFACACCRLIWRHLRDERSRRLVAVMELSADGLVSAEQVAGALADAEDVSLALTYTDPDYPQDVAVAASNAALNTSKSAVLAAEYVSANVVSAAYHLGSADRQPRAAVARELMRSRL